MPALPQFGSILTAAGGGAAVLTNAPWLAAVGVVVVLAVISAVSRVLREGAPGAQDLAQAYAEIRQLHTGLTRTSPTATERRLPRAGSTPEPGKGNRPKKDH